MRIIYFFLLMFISQTLQAQVDLTSGLVAYYPFNGNPNDASSNGNHPIFNNAVLTTDRFGNPNSAYAFNGIDTYMQIPNTPLLNPTAISLCAWVKVTGFYQGRCHGNRIIMKGNSDQILGTYTLTFDDNAYTNSRNCDFMLPDELHQTFFGTYVGATTGPYIQKDTWISLVYTDDGTTAKFYVNCELRNTLTHAQVSFTNSHDLFFGKMNNLQFPYWFNGVMDEIRIYNRILNAAEVLAYASSGRLLNIINPVNDTTVCGGAVIPLLVSGYHNYQWTPATGLSATNIDRPIATVNTTTQYIVTGTSGLGCTEKDTINIFVNPQSGALLSNDTSICAGGTVSLSATGGNSYSWTPVTGLSNPNASNPTATPAVSTQYRVTISNAVCTVVDSVAINVVVRPAFKLSPKDTVVCGMGNLISFNASGGDSYAWLGAGLSNTSIANPTATPNTTGLYTVKIMNASCGFDTTMSTTVTINPAPVVRAAKANDVDCSITSAQLTASGAVTYTWSPAGSLSNAQIRNPIASPVATTLYTVTGTNTMGCSATDTIRIIVDFQKQPPYLMPNAFTPNGDGLNDCFGIKYWGTIQTLQFDIFDRWGKKIFSTTNPAKCWNGKYSSGDLADSGTYVYSIKATTSCATFTRSEPFLLIR